MGGGLAPMRCISRRSSDRSTAIGGKPPPTQALCHTRAEFQSHNSVVELLAAFLLHQRLLDRRLMHFIGMLFTGFRKNAQA